MTEKKMKPPWSHSESSDLGTGNPQNHQLFDVKLPDNPRVVPILKKLIVRLYERDSINLEGEHSATVVKVLSGPQVNNAASTSGGRLTKTVDLRGVVDRAIESEQEQNKPPLVRVLAKIDSFHEYIQDSPIDIDDELGIALAGEFHQDKESSGDKIGQIVAGSTITIKLRNTDHMFPVDGGPMGFIVGVKNIKPKVEAKENKSSKKAHEPKCASTINHKKPPGDVLVGNTDENPNENPGPPIKKIKGRIKTGMHGNGLLHTKHHFDLCMTKSAKSRGNIAGPAPNSDNAFIWIGNLRNNGYMDMVNRPISQGRETVIYAPITLDLSSPIEIKYYFHDVNGFGTAFNKGPGVTVAQAELEADISGHNDFRDEIAPAIKDMIKHGRNFVLVIPELAHSHGDGTVGIQTRRQVENSNKAQIKNHLESLTNAAGYDLLALSPLDNREIHSFDGSFSGGKFGLFHQEVLGVLEEHLGSSARSQVEFISITANGLGGVALAAAVQQNFLSPAKFNAVTSFRDVPIKRIDYIDDGYDDTTSNNFPIGPAATIYRDYLSFLASDPARYLEFNYIVKKTNRKKNTFFSHVNQEEKFIEHIKKKGEGQRRFSFFTNNEINSNNAVSMHVCDSEQVGYAMTMVNDFMSGFPGFPTKKDSDFSKLPAHDAVANHAFIAATRASLSELAKSQKKIQELKQSTRSFEELLIYMNGDANRICADDADPTYKVYCNELRASTGTNSLFFAAFTLYITDKENYYFYKMLAEKLASVDSIKNNRKALEEELANISFAFDDEYRVVADEAKEQLSQIRTTFDPSITLSERTFFSIDDSENGYMDTLTSTVGQYKASKAYIEILNSSIAKLGPSEIVEVANCVDPPRYLRELQAEREAESRPPSLTAFSCGDLNIDPASPPRSYQELYDLIPFKPKRADFAPYDPSAYSRASTADTNIESKTIGGYKASKFKYLARGRNNGTTTKTSYPVWSCISELLEKAWRVACADSNYVPFHITEGIRGAFSRGGRTAYSGYISLHSFGIAIDIDPWLCTGINRNVSRRQQILTDSSHQSVWTGAWSSRLIRNYGSMLYEMGVFSSPPEVLIVNAEQSPGVLRQATQFADAPNANPDSLKGPGSIPRTMSAKNVAGSPIVPINANPTKWLIKFCELSGMRWANHSFLKNNYTEAEQKIISDIYGIPDLVNRVRRISWSNIWDNHTHFQWYDSRDDGLSLVSWREIEALEE